MKRHFLRVFLVVFGLINFILGVSNNVGAEEELLNGDESIEVNSVSNSSEDALPSNENSEGSQEKPVEYVKGQLIVKLKSGHSLTEIQELNERYKVGSTGTVLNKEPSSDETLAQLKQEASGLSAKNDRWYWQLEKNSAEGKEAVEQEKKGLNERIAIEEEKLVSSDKKEGAASVDLSASNLENVFVQNVPEETDILQMAADYRSNPAVEYAEPNYTQQE